MRESFEPTTTLLLLATYLLLPTRLRTLMLFIITR
jgi:hypothetical protein